MAVTIEAPHAGSRTTPGRGQDVGRRAGAGPSVVTVAALVLTLLVGLSVSPWIVAILAVVLAVRAGASRWMVGLVGVATLLLMVAVAFSVSPFHVGPAEVGQALRFGPRAPAAGRWTPGGTRSTRHCRRNPSRGERGTESLTKRAYHH